MADDDIATMPFEKAMAQLEDIVGELERGQVSLEKSIEIFERGEKLKARCDALLNQADARIEKIIQGPDGKAKGTEPLDVD